MITGFCGIWSSTVGSTVEDLLSRVLNRSLHLALMVLFSVSRVEPSADRSSGSWLGRVVDFLDGAEEHFLSSLWQRRFQFRRPSSPTIHPAFCEVLCGPAFGSV